MTAGTGDGEARYAGRGMDGSQFKRESFGLRFEKRNLGDVLNQVQAQRYYAYADHIKDNYTLRAPDPSSAMAMAMASDVDRATWDGRVASTGTLSPALNLEAGMDFQQSRHRARSGTDMVSYRRVNTQVRLSMGVDNLFDKTYSEHLDLAGNAGFGYPAGTAVNEPGRSVRARVSIRY
ncbi:hypothetical protein A7J67_04340 [Achromobacter xylosoxidans]|nr:hypothetical protein A7J67_04340 [Achromobacter xylosoxidans]